MKKILTTLALSALFGVISAQQDAQFSQWMFNKLDFNPGYAGTNNAICGTLLYRDQWVNFPGAPKTALLSVDAPVPLLHGGLGLTVCNDQLGFTTTNIEELAYSFHLPLGPGVLGIGINVGAEEMAMNGAWIATDPVATDPSIPTNKVASTTFDMGLGLYYTTPDGMFFGLSANHIPENSFTKNGTTGNVDALQLVNPNNTPGNFSYQLARHYYVMAGYPIHLNPDLQIIPGVLAKTDGSSFQLDINARAQYQINPEVYCWAGASYRLTDAIVFMVGFNYKRFDVGYSFDLTTSAIKNYSQDTHEIFLRYCFKPFKPPVPSRHSNVRFVS